MGSVWAAACEAPYLGSAVFVPEHEESIWYCPDCLAAGVENRLQYAREPGDLTCPGCPARYSRDEELACAYVAMAGDLLAKGGP